MSRWATNVAAYLALVVAGWFAVGAVVDNEKDRATSIEVGACENLRAVVVEVNRRLVPHEAVRQASLHAVKTAERTARTDEAAQRYHEAATRLRHARFRAVPLPECGGIDER